MTTVGIICEYNPFHLGHERQFRKIRERLGTDTAIICLMSGNFVQRGEPAVFPKMARAAAAVAAGADLVLELPTVYALRSAEGFASGGVELLTALGCEYLSFGSECADADALYRTARLLLAPDFPERLKEKLALGLSFPAARAAAVGAACPDRPNDILAVEYIKAMLQQESPMRPLVIARNGDYHDRQADRNEPSATAVRNCIVSGQSWLEYVPEAARSDLADAPVHTLEAGERAVLARLRTMREDEFAALPFGSEGLWRRLMHCCHTQSTVADILAAAKTKRYTYTRLSRMLLCAYLGITAADLAQKAPYVRILAFNDCGRALLRGAAIRLYNIGQCVEHPFSRREAHWAELYGLFRTDRPEVPGQENRLRVCYGLKKRF